MHTIYHDLTINTSAEKIFDAVSTPYGLNDWWTKRCSGKCELGAVYNLYFADEYNWFAEIVRLIHNEEIEFKMTKAMEEWMPTSFGFILKEEKNNVTSVQFYHKGWTEISKEFRVASYCWANLLHQLKDYLEKGIITPFEERN
ncbi:SRPBCC domain-containing protein [Flavobacterium sp. H122]|uniref:SRPBCC family protein n=1 Tax=Flavobacterium sp. H122 TaxID=2529860 RepID=UPI0010A99B81|nr:SRPBCC domain-containing protein [Flavobacterium sp. H122]